MMIGIWGIILEFYHPGGILPGVVGVISVVLGLYGLHTLPINYAGLALIILAIILFIAEIKIISHGMLTVGGVICLFIGSMMLIDTSSPLENAVQISMGVIITTVIVITALFALLAWLVIKAHRRKAMTGESGMIGEIGEVLADFVNGTGSVKVMGEIWSAESDGRTELQKGSKVKIVNIHDLKLNVQKV